MSKTDRIRGTLVGQAVGDALGAGYEFTAGPAEYGQAKAVMRKGLMGFEPGEWTDDTDQAVAVLLARGDVAKVADGLIAWWRSRPRDVGRQTATILRFATDAESMLAESRAYGEIAAQRVPRPGQVIYPGSANGSLMRTGPVALAHLGNPAAIAAYARQVSDLTHWDPEGWTGDACVLWSLAIDRAIEHGEEFTAASMHDVLTYATMAGLIPVAHLVYWAGVINDAIGGPLPEGRNGSAVQAFKVALHAVAHATDVDSGLQVAISAGHDTDTTAAIAGQLLGAIYGMSGIPAEYTGIVHGWPGLTASDLATIAVACVAVGPGSWAIVPEGSTTTIVPTTTGMSAYAKAGGAPATTLEDHMTERPA